MAQYPLLIFPSSGRAERSRAGGGVSEFPLPTVDRQIARLRPKFNILEQTIQQRAAELFEDPSGLPWEQVLVFETVGNVDSFLTAVRHTQGMEWLADWTEEEIVPDQDFYSEDPQEDELMLSGRLYLVTTNQEAVTQLLSLWARYQEDPESAFARGLAGWKHLFAQLHDVRRWSEQDRYYETGVWEDWTHELQHGSDEIRFEAELWCRQDEAAQQQAYESFRLTVEGEGGECVSQCVIPEIAYHGVLVKAQKELIERVLGQQETRLVKAEQVMLFRPLGQASVPIPEEIEIQTEEDLPSESEPNGVPILAILDGLPIQQHRLLENRLIVDDPDGFEQEYPASDRIHGTGIASLIVNGDLNDPISMPLQHPVYLRPILKPDTHEWGSPRAERIPRDRLSLDIVHRAVRRIVEGEGGETAVSPEVRIINFSIGDPNLQLNRSVSSLAKLLDWLACRYNLLFLVSAGNCIKKLALDIDSEDFESADDSTVQAAVLGAIQSTERDRSLLAPAESINAITVGSANSDKGSATANPTLIQPLEEGLPATYSRIGPGFRRSIKPEILLPGGRMVYRKGLPTTDAKAVLEPTTFTIPPGLKVACPGQTAGEVTATCYSRGTSNSAALAARSAAIILENILELSQRATEPIPEVGLAVLTKALLVHSATWGRSYDVLRSLLCDEDNETSFRDYVCRYLGYGSPSIGRVLACTEQRATVIGQGSLEDGEADIFRFPLPSELSGSQVWRRLTLTLAWNSPIYPRVRGYRGASLWFSPALGEGVGVKHSQAWWQTARRGTVQHLVMDGDEIKVFEEHQTLDLKVNCRADAGKLIDRVQYGLAVSLEVADGIDIPIYNSIRQRLRAPIAIRPEVAS